MKRKQILLFAFLALWVLAVLGYVNSVERTEAPEKTVTADNQATSKFDLEYVVLEFPGEYADVIEHTHTEENGVTTHAFALVHKDVRVELFRIIFGDSAQGKYVGTVQKDNEKVAVSYSVPKHAAEEFADIEVEEYYSKLMEEFNEVLSLLNSIVEPEEDGADEGTSRVEDLTYWTLSLPASITYVETHENESYRVDFYGSIAKRKILLYTIYLGSADADAILGYYQVDGVKKLVSVQSYDLQMQENWSEQDRLTAGALMDTINDVIQAITASERFSVQ